MKARLRSLGPLLAAALLLNSGCAREEESATAPGRGEVRVLKRGNGGDPGSLDPALAEDVHAFNVLLDLYEGLLSISADGSIVPGVAASWTVSADGRVYRFLLREDARWSNGRAVTAGDFVAGFRHVVRPGSRAPAAFLLAPILNHARVLQGELPPPSLGIHAEGARTLIIELEMPALHFPGILTMPIAYPRLAGVHDDAANFRLPSKFVGNGPYLLDEWQPGGVLKLRRNERFHSAATVAIPFVHFFPITDAAAEYNRYRAGEMDITMTIPPAAFATVRAERPGEAQVSAGIGLYYLALDLSEPPFDRQKLRMALSMAIDRQKLVEILGRGEQPAFGLVPPGVAGHVPAAYAWRSEPARQRERLAREAFAAAGIRPGASLPIRLTYDAGDVHEKVALAVRSMWQEVLGLEVELQRLEWKAFLDVRADRSAWQAMRFSWIGDYDDASTFTGLFVSGGLQNLPGYSNRRYDELVQQALSSADPGTRQRLMTGAEQLLIDDYPFVPLYFYVNKHLVSEQVQGYLPNLLDRHPSRYLRFSGS